MLPDTVKTAMKEIEDYFNLEPTDYDRKRLADILLKNMVVVKDIKVVKRTRVIKKTKIKVKPMYVYKTAYNIMNELREVCKIYGMSQEDVIAKEGEGKHARCSEDVRRVRTHFCRKVKSKHEWVHIIELANILKIHYSTIGYYLYKADVEVPYPPFVRQERKKNFDYKKFNREAA